MTTATMQQRNDIYSEVTVTLAVVGAHPLISSPSNPKAAEVPMDWDGVCHLQSAI